MINYTTTYKFIQFNRATTSQLIKWFSNFREFFYIQVSLNEKLLLFLPPLVSLSSSL